jgi:hypothetical protein
LRRNPNSLLVSRAWRMQRYVQNLEGASPKAIAFGVPIVRLYLKIEEYGERQQEVLGTSISTANDRYGLPAIAEKVSREMDVMAKLETELCRHVRCRAAQAEARRTNPLETSCAPAYGRIACCHSSTGALLKIPIGARHPELKPNETAQRTPSPSTASNIRCRRLRGFIQANRRHKAFRCPRDVWIARHLGRGPLLPDQPG